MATRRDFVGACVFGSMLSAAAKSDGEEPKPTDGKPTESPKPAAAGQTHSADVLPKVPTLAVKDADAWIQRAGREHWMKPERLLWRIAYHPIKGLSAQSQWHIEGTHWWVRINPDWVNLDEFDKTKTYEIDAVALDQNYGMIDFYVYEQRIVT